MKPVIVLCCLIMLLICGCAKHKVVTTSSGPDPQLAPQDALVKGNNAFAFKMYKELSNEGTNVLFSPYSISTAFGMVDGGAAGKTEKEISSTMNFSLPQNQLHASFKELQGKINAVQEKKEVQLNVANGLFAGMSFKDAFKKDYFNLVRNDYGAELSFLNFSDNIKSANTINSWVEDKTNKNIQDLINPDIIDPSVALVLVDAIYFKGEWQQKFKPEFTKETDFFTGNSKDVNPKVYMMNLQTDFNYSETDNLQVLELPYTGEELSMIVLLPKDKNGIKELENSLTPENLGLWKSTFQPTTVNVFLPKMKMNITYDKMAGTLQKMGMKSAFSGSADFSNMLTNQKLFISDVIHKAFMVVNEEGTEAAAATGVVMRKTSISPDHKLITFRADHPFICIIQHNPTGSILFMGKMQNPSK